MSLKISDEQAKALGLAGLIPKPPPGPRGMNGLERRYAAKLDADRAGGGIKAYWFESVRLRLAVKTWYLPDFYVLTADGSIECHECKGGRWRDDARVKIKVAATTYPHIRFIGVRLYAGEWHYEYFLPREETT